MGLSDRQIGVLFPGPWRRPLSYTCRVDVPVGSVVLAPLGRTSRPRLGLVMESEGDHPGPVKEVWRVVGDGPSIPMDLMHLIGWAWRWLGVPMGRTLDLVLPRWLFKGEERLMSPPECTFDADRGPRMDHALAPCDADRFMEGVHRCLAVPGCKGVLALLPERTMVRPRLEDALSAGFKALEWPRTPAGQRRAYSRLLSGEVDLVVGCHGAAFVPLPPGWTVYMDDESSESWRPVSYPTFSIRALVVERCRVGGLHLVLGSRFPSSRVYLRVKGAAEGSVGAIERVSQVRLQGGSDGSPPGYVTAPLIRRTRQVMDKGASAIWILDRKGYVGAITCSDCGAEFRCGRCGSPMRSDLISSQMACPACGFRAKILDRCPRCGGAFFQVGRVGLQAVFQEAQGVLKGARVRLVEGPLSDPELRDLVGLSREGPLLVVGTRAVLPLCDLMEVRMMAWLDVDGEAASVAGYDGDARAMGLVYESLWRGVDPQPRWLMLQTRSPNSGWRRYAGQGWRRFWEVEMAERARMGLPPFGCMVRIGASQEQMGELRSVLESLEERGIISGVVEEDGGALVHLSERSRVRDLIDVIGANGHPTGEFPRVVVFSD